MRPNLCYFEALLYCLTMRRHTTTVTELRRWSLVPKLLLYLSRLLNSRVYPVCLHAALRRLQIELTVTQRSYNASHVIHCNKLDKDLSRTPRGDGVTVRTVVLQTMNFLPQKYQGHPVFRTPDPQCLSLLFALLDTRRAISSKCWHCAGWLVFYLLCWLCCIS